MKSETPTFVSTSTAARVLSVSGQTVRRWVKTGKLGGIKTPTGHLRVDLARYLVLMNAACPPQPERPLRRVELKPKAVLPPVPVGFSEVVAAFIAALPGSVTKPELASAPPMATIAAAPAPVAIADLVARLEAMQAASVTTCGPPGSLMSQYEG